MVEQPRQTRRRAQGLQHKLLRDQKEAGKWWEVDDAQVSEMAPLPQGLQAAVYALFLQRAVAWCEAICGCLVDDAPCPVQRWHPQGHSGFHSCEFLRPLPPDLQPVPGGPEFREERRCWRRNARLWPVGSGRS